jgi:hypothetical protein
MKTRSKHDAKPPHHFCGTKKIKNKNLKKEHPPQPYFIISLDNSKQNIITNLFKINNNY